MADRETLAAEQLSSACWQVTSAAGRICKLIIVGKKCYFSNKIRLIELKILGTRIKIPNNLQYVYDEFILKIMGFILFLYSCRIDFNISLHI